MKNFNLTFLIVCFLMIFSCGNTDEAIVDVGTGGGGTNTMEDGEVEPNEWLIPSNEVMDGGPGKDGIPSIDDPRFTALEDVDYIQEFELVIGVLADGEAKVYPHDILDWHEIANDVLGIKSYALTYCPLTGTAIAWNRRINNETNTFGVSGKLYNNNLMPYDRKTDSYWSQLTMSCVNGNLVGEKISTFPVIETTWRTMKRLYPNALVLNRDTGYDRDYGTYPYGDYKTNNDRIIFPLSINDKRLPAKERVFGVIESFGSKTYSIESFESPRAIFDTVGGQDLLIIGSKPHNLICCFINNQGLENFEVDFNQLPNLGQDSNGNVLGINGAFTAGPMAGKQLRQVNAFMGYWFAFGAFYEGIELYEE